MSPLYRRVVELKRTAGQEVSGLHLIAIYVRRCVQPLQFRASPMWRYAGDDDPTRVLHESFSSIELEARVQRVMKIGQKDRCSLEWHVRPFLLENPTAEVGYALRTRLDW